MRSEIKRFSAFAAETAALGALAIAFTALEFALPISAAVSIPGFRLGLANIAIVFAVRRRGFFCGLAVTAIKVAAATLFGGTPMSFLFSLFGSVAAFLIMYLLSRLLKERVGCIGLSVAGAFLHNSAQLLVAAAAMGGAVFCYFPFLAVAALISGVLTGIVAETALRALGRVKKL